MKKLLLLSIVSLGLMFGAVGGRHHDRDWDLTPINLKAGVAQRVTAAQSGMLWIQTAHADMYWSKNATANATVFQAFIGGGAAMDLYPASLNLADGDYFTIFSASDTSVNYTILD